MVSWLVGWFVYLVGWLFVLVMFDRVVQYLVGRLFDWLFGWLVCFVLVIINCVVQYLVGRLVDKLTRSDY